MTRFKMFNVLWTVVSEYRHGIQYIIIQGAFDVRIQARVSDWTTSYGSFGSLTSDDIKALHTRAVKAIPDAPKFATRADRVIGERLGAALAF